MSSSKSTPTDGAREKDQISWKDAADWVFQIYNLEDVYSLGRTDLEDVFEDVFTV